MEQQLEISAGEKTANEDSRDTSKIQTRRVGSVTFGIALICYGILFLVHIFVPKLPYHIIFRCWPVCFIFLGIEILVENHKSRNSGQRFQYDIPAVLMLGVILLFAMVMAAVEVAYTYGYQMYW
ncbi:MAG: hypothetical protein J6K48_03750 [Lachnospiraceae bacterium]|nr:hypothetical protein [Lachnospiraceae bacterium]